MRGRRYSGRSPGGAFKHMYEVTTAFWGMRYGVAYAQPIWQTYGSMLNGAGGEEAAAAGRVAGVGVEAAMGHWYANRQITGPQAAGAGASAAISGFDHCVSGQGQPCVCGADDE